ncbi:hypothetical protein AB1Y20_009903 [Prymnesium parvum]|uniref:Protein xylosyltransferase n=1 Tax=Prymnesium parvum TaxID=97485 RepID=A0AB34K3F4_PRYPA
MVAPAVNGSWTRGYCKGVDHDHGAGCGSQAAGGTVLATRGLCVLFCTLCARCRFVSFAGVDSDCGWFEHCPTLMAMHQTPHERHYTVEAHASAALCLDAEAHARAATAEIASIDHETSRWLRRALPAPCDAPLRELANDAVSAPCASAEHGLFTLTLGETRSWAAAVHGCLQRCSLCARCRFISVAPAHGVCMWHHACARRAASPPCGFRSAAVEAAVARRVAIVFFGKHSDGGRSQSMAPSKAASVRLLELAHGLWRRRVLLANPEVRFDVFAHSWSPEVAEDFLRLWQLDLVAHLHEPTHYTDDTSGHLAFQCTAPGTNCARTASQLLSISKALQLKREHELAAAFQYDFVLTARHDLAFSADLKLVPAMYSSWNTVWFMRHCSHGCTAAKGKVPPGCFASGRQCVDGNHRLFYNGLNWQLFKDWMFGGSSSTVDRMGQASDHFHNYSRIQMTATPYVSTHFIWPYHAAKTGLAISWNLMDGGRVDLARAHMTEQHPGVCHVPTAGSNLVLQHEFPERQFPAEMRWQCPFESAIFCPCDNVPATEGTAPKSRRILRAFQVRPLK